MTKCILVVFFAFQFYLSALGQTGYKKVFNYTLWDGALCITYDTFSKTALICGAGSNNVTGENSTYIIRLDQNANKVWDTTFSDSKDSSLPAFKGITVTKNSSFIHGTGSYDVYPTLIKLENTTNRFSYRKSYIMPPGQSGIIQDLILDAPSNNTFAFGIGKRLLGSKYNCMLFSKQDSLGNNLLQRLICIDNVDLAYSKTFQSPQSASFDMWSMDYEKYRFRLTKVDSLGNIIFSRYPLSNGVNQFHCVTQDKSGNYIVFAKVSFPPFNDRTDIAIKLSPDGDSLASYSFESVAYYYNFVSTDNLGNYILSSSNALLKLDSNFKTVWSKSLDMNLQSLSAVSFTEDEGFWVVGTLTYPDQYGDSLNFMDMVVYRLDVNGEIVGIKEVNKHKLNSSLQLYPNPFSDSFNIEFESERNQVVDLTIYNSLGTKVKTQSYEIEKGGNILNIDIELLPEGIYFIALSTKDRVHTAKAIRTGY